MLKRDRDNRKHPATNRKGCDERVSPAGEQRHKHDRHGAEAQLTDVAWEITHRPEQLMGAEIPSPAKRQRTSRSADQNARD